MGGCKLERYFDFRERDAMLQVLYSQLSLAKLQGRSAAHRCTEINKQIRRVNRY